MAKKSEFDAGVPLPPGLELGAIRRAVDYMEKEPGWHLGYLAPDDAAEALAEIKSKAGVE